MAIDLISSKVSTPASAVHFPLMLSVALVFCTFASPVTAQTPVVVEIKGINQTLEANVRLF